MDHGTRRIGIVGGGASGLAMARALRDRGHDPVTVLEAGPEVGGKCCTIGHEGRSYELGAAILTPAYRHTWALAKRYGAVPKLCLGLAFVDADTGRAQVNRYVPPGLGWGGAARLPLQLARVFVSDLSRRRREFPRLDRMDPSLAEPFEAWCAQNDFGALLETMRPWTTSFGYGFMDEVPAAYMLNYLCLAGPTYELLDEGYRGLWRRVAQDLDVVCSTEVTRIERDATVKVTAGGRELEFDDIVLACPLESALSFLDATDEERALFAQVRYVDYHVIAADVTGLPPYRYGFVPKNFTRENLGKPMFYYRRYTDSNLITFYAFPTSRGDAGFEEEVEKLVRRMGGNVRSIVHRRHWRYFPHVSSAAMRAGFHTRMEALQGVRNTYYASEVLSFSCVEPVVAYAVDLADRHFGGARDTTVGAAAAWRKKRPLGSRWSARLAE
jgi:hypothetical protein